MNSHNYHRKRRRSSGYEDAPVVAAQDPSSASAVWPPSGRCYNETELQILRHAASIVSCDVNDIFALERNPNRRQSIECPPHKRLRVDTNISSMSGHEKPHIVFPSSGQHEGVPQYNDQHGTFTVGAGRSRLASCLASFCSPCTTSDQPGYPGIATTDYGYEAGATPLNGTAASAPSQPWKVPQDPAGSFPYDDPQSAQILPEYPSLQPTRTQPSTRNEEMMYQMQSPDQKPSIHRDVSRTDSHVMDGHELSYQRAPYISPRNEAAQYSSATGYSPLGVEAHLTNHSTNLDVVSNQQRPPPSRRGPFKSKAERDKTAETRKLGSCIRCRMQRIRCEINEDDKVGTCLTCSRVTSTKSYRLPCLRYKITDVRLFKPGNVKGHEWTRRWTEGIADDISNWASMETRTVCVTEGYGSRPVELRVRQFIPQEGDKLERTWVHQGNQKSVKIPPYAIVNLDEAKAIYTNFINEELTQCCRHVVMGKDKLIRGTYGFALTVMMDSSTHQKERDLLRKAFRLWMAIRMTTKSTLIVGQERLGMEADIMDETSPICGKIPLPPVMGAQIELVLIHQLQTKWRREMLEQLQNMTQANNHSTWLTIYLVTFILLHNVSLLCQHDAAYAEKHGMKRADGTKAIFAREDMVKEYQLGANILLAYFHYCNKGIYPFSVDCTEQDLSTLAKLDAAKSKFVYQTRVIIQEQRRRWAKVRQINDYQNDMYFISQLFEEKWEPQSLVI